MTISSKVSAHINELARTVPWHGSVDSTDQVSSPAGILYSSSPLWTSAETHNMSISSSTAEGSGSKNNLGLLFYSSKIKAETEAPPEGNFSPLLGHLFAVCASKVSFSSLSVCPLTTDRFRHLDS